MYQKDPGRDAAKLAEEMKVYNPDSTWKTVDGNSATGK
ncbi:MAG: DUF2950 family protein [Candidatus Xenobiia bacterium LiM19]